jgi:hypothetical protein
LLRLFVSYITVAVSPTASVVPLGVRPPSLTGGASDDVELLVATGFFGNEVLGDEAPAVSLAHPAMASTAAHTAMMVFLWLIAGLPLSDDHGTAIPAGVTPVGVPCPFHRMERA